jgi:hypothetical protein
VIQSGLRFRINIRAFCCGASRRASFGAVSYKKGFYRIDRANGFIRRAVTSSRQLGDIGCNSPRLIFA